MTIDHPVRRLLARVCSPDTMLCIVDPTLADMSVEPGRPAWRGYLALMRALTLQGVTSSPGVIRHVWSDDEYAVPRAVGFCVFTTLMLAAALVALPTLGQIWPGHVGAWRSLALLMPQATILALPASLLVAIPLVFSRTSNRRRVIVRSLALSVACAVATLALATRVMPDSNQAFRVATSGLPDIPRGPNEMAMSQLREHIEILRLTSGEHAAVTFEYAYQIRLALVSIAIPLGLLGAAIALARRGRPRPVFAGAGAIFVYLVVIFRLDELATARLLATGAVSAAFLAAWTPTIAVLALSVVALRRAREPLPVTGD